MDVGIICEGSTDFAVLQALCDEILGKNKVFVTLLQPNYDALQMKARGAGSVDPGLPGTGWQGVRAFLGQARIGLPAATHDVILVHVDADIRHLDAVKAKLRGDGQEPIEQLCDHVKSWMQAGLPQSVVIVLPRESIEAWLLAAHTNRHNVESIEKPADVLRSMGLMGDRGAKKDKQSVVYEKLAVALATLVRDPRQLGRVPELERFVSKLKKRASEVRKGARKKPG